MDTEFSRHFQNTGYDFDSDPFFKNSIEHFHHANESFEIAKKVIFIFVGIVFTLVVT